MVPANLSQAQISPRSLFLGSSHSVSHTESHTFSVKDAAYGPIFGHFTAHISGSGVDNQLT